MKESSPPPAQHFLKLTDIQGQLLYHLRDLLTQAKLQLAQQGLRSLRNGLLELTEALLYFNYPVTDQAELISNLAVCAF